MHNPHAFILAQTETSTATWAVLMVVIGFIMAGVWFALRILFMRVAESKRETDKAIRDADEAKSETQTARHNEIKTMIGSVEHGVHAVGSRVEDHEKRLGHLEKGHARIQQELKGLGAHHD